MRPISSFSAMFLWATLIIAVVGVAVSLTQGAWVPSVAWAIVAGGAAAALMRVQCRQADNIRALKAARARREHSANRDKNDHT
ncbi:MAG: hypothetical protein OXE50_14410 [Chloroflexi bacterium]|uniref:hypothetical protein n=1 Tax=Rhodococcus sp. MEB032 TaxID=3040322 RepID=UPI0022A235AF|nr:hypothetical protein [Rhodococcus sp. MEB032]MCY4583967.1 hypothetical protein [Chloroflexota bacterium]